MLASNSVKGPGVFGVVLALLLPLSALADGRYIVQFRDAAKGKAAVAAAGAKVLTELLPQNAVAAHIPDHTLSALRNNPNIEFIEEDPIRVPFGQTTPYGIEMVQATQAQSSIYGSTPAFTNRTVCI